MFLLQFDTALPLKYLTTLILLSWIPIQKELSAYKAFCSRFSLTLVAPPQPYSRGRTVVVHSNGLAHTAILPNYHLH